MKIAMLMSNPLPPQEGIGNYVQNLSDKLAKRGHTLMIITRGGLTSRKLTFRGIRVFELPFIMCYPFHVNVHGIFVNEFLRELEGNLDVVHVHTPLSPSVSAQIPLVTTFHTPNFVDSFATHPDNIRLFLTKILGILSYRIEKSLISSSQVVTAVSDGVASDLAKYYGVPHRQIGVLGNAPSDEFLEAGRVDTEHKDDAMILYVGGLLERKGVLTLVECMKSVTKRVPSARLIVVGMGPLQSAVVSKVAELKLQEHVEVKGFVSRQELLETIRRASIFVVPSYYEGLPTVMLEAMACKLAVVATAVRGNLDLVRHGDTGMLVPPRSPETLATAITRLLEDPELRSKLGKNGRRLVEQQFTWDRVADRALAAYERAMSRCE